MRGGEQLNRHYEGTDAIGLRATLVCSINVRQRALGLTLQIPNLRSPAYGTRTAMENVNTPKVLIQVVNQ